ncbi:uncharacterized protein LOC135116428 isoform X2 [Scylla paramamosain]
MQHLLERTATPCFADASSLSRTITSFLDQISKMEKLILVRASPISAPEWDLLIHLIRDEKPFWTEGLRGTQFCKRGRPGPRGNHEQALQTKKQKRTGGGVPPPAVSLAQTLMTYGVRMI